MRRALLALLALAVAGAAGGAVLPEDRADVLYHEYSGGGVTVNGPSVLVRKQVGEKVSVVGNYYVDSVSSASVDVELAASEYTERRVQQSLGVDYLRGGTIMSASYTNSSESDYEANTASLSISQDMFGDLTTVSLGFERGWDTVGQSTDPSFERDVDRRNYRFGLSQILTRNLIATLNYEAVTDEGHLNNPYRAYRFYDPSDSTQFNLASENGKYPRTRTSGAARLGLKYFLPWRAAVYASYRYFDDTWEIRADTYEVGYTHTLESGWVFDVSYRYYTQTAAEFYADIFQREDEQNFMARDKELSTYQAQTLGLGVSYDFLENGWGFIDRGSVNLFLDHMRFTYDDFRDATASGYDAGQEPLYEFDALVTRAFISIWY